MVVPQGWLDSSVWKEVPGFPGYYAAQDGRILGRRGRLMSACEGSSTYLQVTVRANGKPTTQYVHRLVMLAFEGPCPDGLEVRHLDGDRYNNHKSNLAYGTHLENMEDKMRTFVPQERCKLGHLLSGDNMSVVIRADGKRHRRCLACHASAQRAYKARRRERLSGAAAWA